MTADPGLSAPSAAARLGRQALARPGTVRIAAILLFIALALATPGFLSLPSITGLLTAISFVGCIAVGMTLITISGNIMSFSLGLTISGASLVFAAVLNVASFAPAVLAALAFGALVSGLQGVAIGAFKANPIIVSIGTLALLHGLLQTITQGVSVYISGAHGQAILNGKLLGMPIEFVIFIGVLVVGQFILSFTVFGRNLLMIGDSPNAAEAAGVRPWRTIGGAYLWAGLFSAITGVVFAARFGNGSMEYGQGYDYGAIAAILVGGTAIQGGQGSVLRTFVGAGFIALVQSVLLLYGVRQQWQFFNIGLIVLVVIMLQAGEAGGSGAAATTVLKRAINPHLRPLALLAGAIVLMTLLDIGNGRFLTATTAFSALQLLATLGPVALGLGLTMLIREFDLSVAGTFGMAGCIAVLTGAAHPALGVALAVLAGLVGGVGQGLVITRLRLGSIGVTLGGLLLFVGIAYVLTGSKSIPYDNLGVALAVNNPVAGIFSLRSLVAVAVFAVAALVVGCTRIGRDLIATGSDRRAALIAGVGVDRLLIATFAASGGLAALSGALVAYGLASASPSGLSDVLVPATAAAILGGVSLSGGAGRPLGIAAGVLTLAVLRSGLNGLGASAAMQDIVTGAILLAVAIADGRAFGTRVMRLGLVLRPRR